MYEQRISPLIVFISYPLFRLNKNNKISMYELHLELSSWPKRILSYLLILPRLYNLIAK